MLSMKRNNKTPIKVKVAQVKRLFYIQNKISEKLQTDKM